jgi:hypothetical protein
MVFIFPRRIVAGEIKAAQCQQPLMGPAGKEGTKATRYRFAVGVIDRTMSVTACNNSYFRIAPHSATIAKLTQTTDGMNEA